jgi:hypothetical protein
MKAWAACIQSTDRDSLAALRLFPGTECAEIGGLVWLRGNSSGEELDRALAMIPGLERFELLASGHLKSPHSRIPHGNLPASGWRSLKATLVPVLPSAVLPGEIRRKLPLTLVRSRVELTPSALLASLESWTEFASHAPALRLASLSFAVAENQQTLITGQPLPTLPGVRLVNRNGILTPCGYAWSPAVDAAVLREVFGLGNDDVVVLDPDSTHQVIRAEQFVSASRSAARMTTAGFQA